MAVKRICSAAAAIRINTTVAMANSAIATSPPFLLHSDKQKNHERDAAAKNFNATLKILEKKDSTALCKKYSNPYQSNCFITLYHQAKITEQSESG